MLFITKTSLKNLCQMQLMPKNESFFSSRCDMWFIYFSLDRLTLFIDFVKSTCSLMCRHGRKYIFLLVVKYTQHTLIKKKIKFSSYIRKFRMEQLQSHTVQYMANGLLICIWGNMCAFPYIKMKFSFLSVYRGSGNRSACTYCPGAWGSVRIRVFNLLGRIAVQLHQ